MQFLTDQTGRKVELAHPPRRIVSTVPSITELLFDLGLADEVVGITAYCVHPRHWLKEKAVIGGTKNLQVNKIRELRPDLIIANKEENIREQIEDLQDDIPVWLTEVVSFSDALRMIEDIGLITGKAADSEVLLQRIEQERKLLEPVEDKISVVTLIWKDPWMAVSGDTYIHSMLDLIGLQNIFTSSNSRYPEISLMELEEQQPRLILLTSEPYSFNSLDMRELSFRFPGSHIEIVDGEHLSWYGSHLAKAIPYLRRLQANLKLRFHYL